MVGATAFAFALLLTPRLQSARRYGLADSLGLLLPQTINVGIVRKPKWQRLCVWPLKRCALVCVQKWSRVPRRHPHAAIIALHFARKHILRSRHDALDRVARCTVKTLKTCACGSGMITVTAVRAIDVTLISRVRGSLTAPYTSIRCHRPIRLVYQRDGVIARGAALKRAIRPKILCLLRVRCAKAD